MRNLHKYIKENYGWDALRELQQWKKGEIKQDNYPPNVENISAIESVCHKLLD